MDHFLPIQKTPIWDIHGLNANPHPPHPPPHYFSIKKKKKKKKDSTSIVSLLVKHPNLSPPSIFIIQEQQQPLTKVIVWFERIFIFKDQKKKKIKILKKTELPDNKTAKTRKTQLTKNKITTKSKTPQPHTKSPIFYKKNNENKKQ